MSERAHGRELFMYGNASARARLLVAGCANGRRCAGTDVVRTAMVGCPPTDAEIWFLPTLRPSGADLDVRHARATQAPPSGARPSPTCARASRSCSARAGARVRATGPDLAAARRFARTAGLPFERGAPPGLAAWTTTVRPRTTSITVELPGERASARRAVRLAYALDRLAGTRFAAGALQERLGMIQHHQDPRM